jgi:hypothetical protein
MFQLSGKQSLHQRRDNPADEVSIRHGNNAASTAAAHARFLRNGAAATPRVSDDFRGPLLTKSTLIGAKQTSPKQG